MSDTSLGNQCSCGYLELLMRFSNPPVGFDAVLSEYYIRFPGSNETYPMRYCPNCGLRLPRSRRGEFFRSIDEREAHEATRRLATARTVSDVVALLGEPVRASHLGTREPGNAVVWERALYFASDFSSFEIVVLEGSNGTIRIVYSPRRL
jgi:hypothetical protein